MRRATLPVTYAEPDLKVTALSVPDDLRAGQTLDITFTVTNTGTRATRETGWVDRVYLSLDSSLDTGDFLLRREVAGREITAQSVRRGALGVGESYTATVTVTLPFELNGDFHILAVADSDLEDSYVTPSTLSPRLAGLAGRANGIVQEFQGEGNNTTFEAITVSPSRAAPMKFVLLSRVVVPAAPSGRFSVAPKAPSVSAKAMTAPPCRMPPTPTSANRRVPSARRSAAA